MRCKNITNRQCSINQSINQSEELCLFLLVSLRHEAVRFAVHLCF